jgi:hypothetical protein
MQGIFVFLDLLGFSHYVGTDLSGAARMLNSQQNILNVGLDDAAFYKAKGVTPDSFQAEHLTTSFHHFLPFSDSLCISSSQPDLFLPQLAHFLISAFHFTAHAYETGPAGRSPENIKVAVIGPHGLTHEQQNWFPVLWRGGMSFGRIECVGSRGVIDGKRVETPLLIGEAVVRAVKMEKPTDDEALRKGPRLFCDPSVRSSLTDSRIAAFIVPAPGIPNCEEFLWPAFLYHADGNPRNALFEMHRLLEPAIALWRSKRGTGVENHYFEFVHLICRSTLVWAAANGIDQVETRAIVTRSLETYQAGELGSRILV